MRKIFLLITILATALSSCNREDSHIVLPDNSEQLQGGVIVGLNTDKVTNTKFEDTHLYGFDATQKMILHRYYATQKELSSDLFQMERGAYTFLAVLNVGKDFASTMQSKVDAPLPDATLNQLMSYVKRVEPNHPDMLTGMVNRTITDNDVIRINIPLADKSGGIASTTINTTIILPDAEFEAYQKARTKATLPHNLRGVVEFYEKDKTTLVYHTVALLTPTAMAGSYTIATEMPTGDYDMLVWVDYALSGSTTNLWYDANNLQAIQIIATDKSYTTGSDTREVFYGTTSFTATGKDINISVSTERPQAKYVLIADDVQRYRELMIANPEKYVPLSDLSIAVVYEGYLPDGFNVKTGKPNSSELGYKYKNALSAVGATDTEVNVGSDYVLVNGSESSVTVTVLVIDKAGRTISRVQGVKVEYKRNMLTTVRGSFLTAGVINPGINIDTDWDGVYNVEF